MTTTSTDNPYKGCPLVWWWSLVVPGDAQV